MMRKTRSNKVNKTVFGTHVDANNFKGKEKERSEMHSRSTSCMSTEKLQFDSRSSMNLGFSSASRSSISSRADSPSWKYNSSYDIDMQDAMETPLTDDDYVSHKDLCIWDDLLDVKEVSEIEVVAYGTQLMATILFPTVIIKMDKRKLHDSMLYYVILQPSSGQYFEDIVCLMFSSRSNSENDLQTAELLPLRPRGSRSCPGGMSFMPMLLDKQYRSIFEKGCIFQLMAIERGRRLDKKGRRWKDYDIEKSEIRGLLRTLLFLDISQIPKYMVNPVKNPSYDAEEVSKNSETVKEISYPKQKFEVDLQYSTPSSFSQEDRRGRKVRRRSSFAKFLDSPHNRVNNNLVSTPKLGINAFKNSYKFSNYISFSMII
jgi:hypothetical protein